MLDNHSSDFDLQVRSMLEDAEVKPSRRVWKGVSSRLDASAAPVAGPWAWMKWAGMSLAAAAAIAAGIFFTGTQDTSIPTNHNNQPQVMLAQVGDTAGPGAEVPEPAVVPAEDPALLPATPSRPASRRPVAGQRSSQDHSADPLVADGSAGEPEGPATDGSADPAVTVPPGSGPAAAKSTPAVRPVPDHFAGMEPVRKPARKVALYAQGSLGSNESVPVAAGRTAWMAPGATSDFVELGSSTYGVPLTLGLGVRFYLMPRFSFGTGLDYSLLTRTFPGSFNGVSGSISHTLHYLGVPLNLYYDVISSERIKFYVYGGGEAEFCLSNKYRLFGSPDIVRSYPVNGLQFSVGGGLGVEFKLSGRFGLYVDPGVRYYFPGGQPRSIRTDKPLMVNFDAGVRFNF